MKLVPGIKRTGDLLCRMHGLIQKIFAHLIFSGVKYFDNGIDVFGFFEHCELGLQKTYLTCFLKLYSAAFLLRVQILHEDSSNIYWYPCFSQDRCPQREKQRLRRYGMVSLPFPFLMYYFCWYEIDSL